MTGKLVKRGTRKLSSQNGTQERAIPFVFIRNREYRTLYLLRFVLGVLGISPPGSFYKRYGTSLHTRRTCLLDYEVEVMAVTISVLPRKLLAASNAFTCSMLIKKQAPTICESLQSGLQDLLKQAADDLSEPVCRRLCHLSPFKPQITLFKGDSMLPILPFNIAVT